MKRMLAILLIRLAALVFNSCTLAAVGAALWFILPQVWAIVLAVPVWFAVSRLLFGRFVSISELVDSEEFENITRSR